MTKEYKILSRINGIIDAVRRLSDNYVLRIVDDIEDRIKILDPKVTDPIMVGKLIWGDENYLKRIKQKVHNQPITEKAIEYNFQQGGYHARKSQDSALNEHFQTKNLRSSKTYLTNALALKEGDKVLTFNGPVDYSHSLSHSEKFIELKGGIE